MRLVLIVLTTVVIYSVSVTSTVASSLPQPGCDGSACGEIQLNVSDSGDGTHSTVTIQNKGDKSVTVEYRGSYDQRVALCRGEVETVNVGPGKEASNNVLGPILCAPSGKKITYNATYGK